jgi:hypothetical protein
MQFLYYILLYTLNTNINIVRTKIGTLKTMNIYDIITFTFFLIALSKKSEAAFLHPAEANLPDIYTFLLTAVE